MSENINVETKLKSLTKDLEPVKELFESVCKKHNLNIGVSLVIRKEKACAIIDVEEIKKD